MTILVIDIGSSSIRALLFDHQAQAIPETEVSRDHRFSATPPGAATAEAEHLRRLVEWCLDEILHHPLAGQIEAVGLTTFAGNLVGVDANNRPLTPVYTYADIRSARDVGYLHPQIDLAATYQRTGCRLHTAYHPARLHWLRRTEPDLFDQVTCWLDLGSYLYRHWFGREIPVSYSMASWSGLFNRNPLNWDAAWLHALDLPPATLPPLADYNTPQIGLLEAYARRWPVLRETPFFLAVGDGAAANIGLGAVDPTHIGLTVGTTAALRVVTTAEAPLAPEGLWAYRVDAAHHLLGGATSEGGNIFRWAREVLNLAGTDLEMQLSQAEPAGHGLTFLPLLAGERSPGWAGQATGSIAGLRLSTTPVDILQAALEGVALRLSLVAEQLASVADEQAVLMAGGGALAASPAWAQIIANALNRPLHLVAETETTARGVALLVLKALGRCSLADHPPAIVEILTPQSQAVAALRAAREQQQLLYQKLIGEGRKMSLNIAGGQAQ